MYLILIGVALSFLSIIEQRSYKKNLNYDIFFELLFLILTLLLCFRYGQGTDYFAYEEAYEYTRKNAVSVFNNVLLHGEAGWYALMFLSAKCSLCFEEFILFISFLMMFFTFLALNRYSRYKNFSLLILFPTYYLTYYYSAIRQGLAISIFLYYGINFIHKNKWLKFILFTLVLSSIHTSMLIFLITPIALKMIRKRNKLHLLLFAFGISYAVYCLGIVDYIQGLRGSTFYTDSEISIPAIVVRLILFFVIYKMHEYIKQKNIYSTLENTLYDFYFVGVCLFILLQFYLHLSQRLTVGFKITEVFLIPLQVQIINKIRKMNVDFFKQTYESKAKILAFVIIVIMISNIELIKNINGYIQQKNYHEWINFINYPYISVFNKDDISIYMNNPLSDNSI